MHSKGGCVGKIPQVAGIFARITSTGSFQCGRGSDKGQFRKPQYQELKIENSLPCLGEGYQGPTMESDMWLEAERLVVRPYPRGLSRHSQNEQQ